MAKAYWTGRFDVTDPQAYQVHIAADAVAFKKFGARLLRVV